MGSGMSRRYKYGIRPKKYFNTKIMPDLAEVFSILDFDYKRAFQLFKTFIDIDFDNSTEVTVDEFHEFIGLKASKFTERIFGILDMDETGTLDFKEFVIGIWNYCTYDALLITKFAFDIFDIDDIGKLQLAECEALIRMVYDDADADPDLMKKIDTDGDGEITIDEFAALITRQPQILQPAFDVQRALRMKCFGMKYWEAATEKRKQFFANYDSLANSSWESIQKILQIRSKEREADTIREGEEFVAEATERMNEHKDAKTKQHSEMQDRKQKTLERIRSKELPEEKEEREMWTKLIEQKTNLDQDTLYNGLEWRTQCRQELWNLLDKLIEMHEITLCAQEVRDVALAEGPDGDAKALAYLATKAGKKKLRFDTSAGYGKAVHDHWVKGNPLQRSLAPLFRPEVEGQITYASRITSKLQFGGKRDLKLAEENARGSTIESYHKLDREVAKDKYFELRAQSEYDFQSLKKEIIETHGTRNTRWERLFDDTDNNNPSYYMINTGSMQTLDEKKGRVSICEMCDSEIEGLDYKCYNCNTLRSAVNEERYCGHTSIEDLKEMDVDGKENTIGAVDCSDPSGSKIRGDGGGGGGLLEDGEEDGGGEGNGKMGRLFKKTRTFRRTLTKHKSVAKGLDVGKRIGRKVRRTLDKM